MSRSFAITEYILDSTCGLYMIFIGLFRSPWFQTYAQGSLWGVVTPGQKPSTGPMNHEDNFLQSRKSKLFATVSADKIKMRLDVATSVNSIADSASIKT